MLTPTQSQVRTFSRDELRSLFRVDPTARCDTHAAIKCGCDGSAAAAAAKADDVRQRAAAAAAAAAAAGSEGGGTAAAAAAAEVDLGVAAWAHLADAADSPDPTWPAVPGFARDKFVSFLFSDHTLAGAGPPAPPAPTAAGEGGEEEEGEEGEDEEEREVQSQPCRDDEGYE